MLWLKALHLVFMVTWFAGLFYLPRIFVYHAATGEGAVRETFKLMERRLMVMTHIGGSLTWLFGLALLASAPGLWLMAWLKVKLVLVLLLLVYHAWCALLVRAFARGEVRHGSRWFRWFNEFPTLILIAVVLLAVLKPA